MLARANLQTQLKCAKRLEIDDMNFCRLDLRKAKYHQWPGLAIAESKEQRQMLPRAPIAFGHSQHVSGRLQWNICKVELFFRAQI